MTTSADLIPGALYLRQSEDRTGEELAVSRQEEDGQEVAGRRGVHLVATITDNDLSAAGKKKRPGFEELLNLVRSGQVRVIIAYTIHRLTRNRRDTVRLIEACQDHRVTIMLVRGTDFDMATPAGRLLADLLAAVARNEIEEKADRQARANLQAAEQGRRVGGRRPFGYEQDGMTIRLAEAQAIRQGYSMLLTGASLGEIARQWNAAGLVTGQNAWKRGGPSAWQPGAVRNVLHNPRHAGIRRYRSKTHGTLMFPAAWPAIVPEETWREACAILDDPARARYIPRGGPRLLSAIALCGVCGATVHTGTSRIGYPTYRCRAAYGHISRQALPVEEFVATYIAGRLSRPGFPAELDDTARPGTAALRLERATLESRLDALAVAAVDGDLTPAQLRAASRHAAARIAEINSMITDAGKVSVLAPLLSAADKRAAWDELTTMQKRAVIPVLAVIHLDPAGRGTRIFRPQTVRIADRGQAQAQPAAAR